MTTAATNGTNASNLYVLATGPSSPSLMVEMRALILTLGASGIGLTVLVMARYSILRSEDELAHKRFDAAVGMLQWWSPSGEAQSPSEAGWLPWDKDAPQLWKARITKDQEEMFDTPQYQPSDGMDKRE